MTAQFTVSRSILATLLNQANPAVDDTRPPGPYGPVVRFVDVFDRHWSQTASPVPDPWRGIVAATATIRYALDRQDLAESIGAGDRAVEAGRTSIQRFVDDFCGTPPKLYWPFPWPPPPWWSTGDIGPMDILVAGAQFHQTAETLPDNPLAAVLDSAADKLLETGLQQLGQ